MCYCQHLVFRSLTRDPNAPPHYFNHMMCGTINLPDEHRPLWSKVGAISAIIPPESDQSCPADLCVSSIDSVSPLPPCSALPLLHSFWHLASDFFTFCFPVSLFRRGWEWLGSVYREWDRLRMGELTMRFERIKCPLIELLSRSGWRGECVSSLKLQTRKHSGFPDVRCWVIVLSVDCSRVHVHTSLIKRPNVNAKHGQGFDAKQPPPPSPSAQYLEMCSIRTFLFVALFAWRAMFSVHSLPVGPNWVTINGPIVEVTGCFGSSQGFGNKLEGKEREKKKGKWKFFCALFPGLEDGTMATLGCNPHLQGRSRDKEALLLC